jgi:hypothetical protein
MSGVVSFYRNSVGEYFSRLEVAQSGWRVVDRSNGYLICLNYNYY